MTTYQARIAAAANGGFFAMVVRIDADGTEQLARDFKARHFDTEAGAQRATQSYIAKVAA
jgi:hypothetical protein